MKRLKIMFVYSSCILLIIAFWSMISVMVMAKAENPAVKKEMLIDRVKEEFYLERQNPIEESLSSQNEYEIKNSESNMYYNVILDHVNTCNDELRRHFSGAYINESGELVVLMCCESERCHDFVCYELNCKGVVFAKGNGSYYDTMQVLDSINSSIASLQELVAKKKADERLFNIMKMYPRARYNVYTNSISVLVNVDSSILPYVENKELDARDQYLRNQVVQEYYECTSLLKSMLNLDSRTEQLIEVIPESGYEPATDCTET